jgi:hypothetical protein
MINYSLILSTFYAGKAWVLNGDQYEGLDWFDIDPKPTKEELDSKNIDAIKIFKINNCKEHAKTLISQSDWSVLPDVKLQNKSDFENYRSKLRELIINPVENPEFPITPEPIWSN